MNQARCAPPISDYGLIGDGHSCALVSRSASIDWCCMPRLDSASCFGRLLDWEHGGACTITIDDAPSASSSHAYVGETLVLKTVLQADSGAVQVFDFFALRRHDGTEAPHELVRILECCRGSVPVRIGIAPRFDYGAVRPWLRRAGIDVFMAFGGDAGLLICVEGEAEIEGDSLVVHKTLQAGERLRLLMRSMPPHRLEEQTDAASPRPEELDRRLDQTIDWWQRWRSRLRFAGEECARVTRSALTLKALTYGPTGAIAAAASTSLPEVIGGARNWDYRFSWIRDSTLAAHALAELGCEPEAERSRHFIVRSSAGHADDLQILFGVGGERRIGEQELELTGYRGSRPVRIGNGAGDQLQLDALGEILNLAWRWHLRGHSPDDDEWRFFSELVETAISRWSEPDNGIWEWRGRPRHFVHSKAGCWAAVDRGLRLARDCARKAPVRRWQRARREIREAIETRGYDTKRGVFVRCFDEQAMDASLLLLPVVGFVEFDDERMVRTTDSVRDELEVNGLLRRYRGRDSLPGREGAFLPACFWLAECYARQARQQDAQEVFDRAVAASNSLGLFSEQVDPDSGDLLGNYPQALSHLSHIAAAIAISQAAPKRSGPPT
jgi:GH15 family glucan-1,4-alpha-glucosidase